MTSIVAFPLSHIEISNGIVTAEGVTNADGTTDITTGIGRMAYLVESVDDAGGRLCLWDCTSHADAVDRADALRQEGWGPVIDRVTA